MKFTRRAARFFSPGVDDFAVANYVDLQASKTNRRKLSPTAANRKKRP
jgi:hypothetical protein